MTEAEIRIFVPDSTGPGTAYGDCRLEAGHEKRPQVAGVSGSGQWGKPSPNVVSDVCQMLFDFEESVGNLGGFDLHAQLLAQLG